MTKAKLSDVLQEQEVSEEVRAAAKARIDFGLAELRKQCKQLSKNQLITALLQQLEAHAQLQGICQQLIKENQTLKGSQNEVSPSQP